MHGSTTRSPRSPRLGVIETQLVRAGRADERAFAELYDLTAPGVYGLVLQVVGDPHEAEEVARETFLKIWRMSARFDPAQGSGIGWMLAIAHRHAVDRVRAGVGTQTDEHPRVAVLAALPSTQQRALELAYFAGYTCADISRLLQAPVDAVLAGLRTSLLALRPPLGRAADRRADQAS